MSFEAYTTNRMLCNRVIITSSSPLPFSSQRDTVCVTSFYIVLFTFKYCNMGGQRCIYFLVIPAPVSNGNAQQNGDLGNK